MQRRLLAPLVLAAALLAAVSQAFFLPLAPASSSCRSSTTRMHAEKGMTERRVFLQNAMGVSALLLGGATGMVGGARPVDAAVGEGTWGGWWVMMWNGGCGDQAALCVRMPQHPAFPPSTSFTNCKPGGLPAVTEAFQRVLKGQREWDKVGKTIADRDGKIGDDEWVATQIFLR